MMDASNSNRSIECPVCFERYNNLNCLPKILKCGHTCCLSCTSVVVRRRKFIACPICRTITKSTPTLLPTNYSMLDVVASSSQCPRRVVCSKHSTENLEIYCSSCRILVCSLCFFKEHLGHIDMERLGLDQLKISFDSALRNFNEARGDISNKLEYLKKVVVELQSKETEITTSIHDTFNQIRTVADVREEALMSSMISKRLAVEATISFYETHLDFVSNDTNEFGKLVQEFKLVNDETSREELTESMLSLNRQIRTNDYGDEYDSYLTWNCNSDALIQSINQFGDINGHNEIAMKVRENERECRRAIIDILKKTRGEWTWNNPGDDGRDLNWAEGLPLGEWNGSAPGCHQKRIQLDENGMITTLYLSGLGMRGAVLDQLLRSKLPTVWVR